MKKILLAGLLVSSMFYNVACDSTDVAIGVIGVGIGIGLSGMDDGSSNHHRDHDRDHHRGDYGRGGGYDGGRCDSYRCYNAASVESGSNLLEAAAEMQTASFSQKHNIPEAAGVKIQKAFANVSQSGLASFQSIGLNEKALNKIMSREMPETPAIQSMGQKLGLSEGQARQLLHTLVAEFDAEASNSQSNYWQSCQAKGQWKTPQNAFCKDGAWNGCSPETGASLCI